ncbi:MAG TPA: RtcB family protein [Chthonomonadales bacterium]|nr:RtcB family protein [Chthonomonadales bacterium]
MRPEQIVTFGVHDEATLTQIRRSAAHEAVVAAALCADGHKGYAVPIGGVIAYDGHISPSGVGYDIACGNKAVRLDAHASEIRPRIGKIMDDIWQRLSFGIGMKNKERVEHPLFDDQTWKLPAVKPLRDLARQQLGTIGSGVSRPARQRAA